MHSEAGYLASISRERICCGRKRSPCALSLCLPCAYRRRGAGGRQWWPVTALWAARRWPLSLALHDCLRHYRHTTRFLFMRWGIFLQSVCPCSVCEERKASRIEASFHLNTEINTGWERRGMRWKLFTGQRAANTFHCGLNFDLSWYKVMKFTFRLVLSGS